MTFFLVELCFFYRIGAYRNNYRIQFLKLRIVFRELAEFEGAVRSPISLIKIEQDIMSGIL
jgi:hypothetical protein